MNIFTGDSALRAMILDVVVVVGSAVGFSDQDRRFLFQSNTDCTLNSTEFAF